MSPHFPEIAESPLLVGRAVAALAAEYGFVEVMDAGLPADANGYRESCAQTAGVAR